MLPNDTLFNGGGRASSISGYRIPLWHFLNTKNKRGTHHLVVMDISKNKIVHAWYNDVGEFNVGIRKHTRILNDNRGRYFMVNGNKIRF